MQMAVNDVRKAISLGVSCAHTVLEWEAVNHGILAHHQSVE